MCICLREQRLGETERDSQACMTIDHPSNSTNNNLHIRTLFSLRAAFGIIIFFISTLPRQLSAVLLRKKHANRQKEVVLHHPGPPRYTPKYVTCVCRRRELLLFFLFSSLPHKKQLPLPRLFHLLCCLCVCVCERFLMELSVSLSLFGGCSAICLASK